MAKSNGDVSVSRGHFSVTNFIDCFGVMRAVGEIWFDRAGNECFFRNNGTISCRTVNNEESMTVQSEKDSCDFNLIHARFMKTGLMTNMRRDPPQYGDFSSASDYHDSVLRAQQAEEAFMTLPALIRARFKNDPGQLIDFLADSSNRPEAVKLGLINVPQVDEKPADVGVQNSPTSTST